MCPLIYCILKCLIFKQLLKIANISAKIVLESRKISVPLLSETGTKPDTAKLIDNTDSENASREALRFRFVAVPLMLYKNG